MSSQVTTRIQVNPSATLGQVKLDETLFDSETTSTASAQCVVNVPTSGTVTLPLPTPTTGFVRLYLAHLGGVSGATGSEVFVNLKGAAAQTTGVTLPAPAAGNNAGGQFSCCISTTSGQTNALVATSITLGAASGATVVNQILVVATWR
jgi:hypothetical protein